MRVRQNPKHCEKWLFSCYCKKGANECVLPPVPIPRKHKTKIWGLKLGVAKPCQDFADTHIIASHIITHHHISISVISKYLKAQHD